MDYKILGSRIRERRRALHITQEQLAETAEISASFLGHIERGSRIASLDTFVRICIALQVAPNDLLGAEMAVRQTELPDLVTVSPVELLQAVARAIVDAGR